MTDGAVPGALDPEQLGPGLHGEVARLASRGLDEEAVLPLVHVLALLDHPEHRLVHLVALHVGTAPVRGIELKGEKKRKLDADASIEAGVV